uniref:Neurotransmitter-gated ion-channel ligand-binding domain-containing protein n=1 Tax=Plectus sambesii TaxID=2011161 RepID=A0A914W8B4_9BILA
MWLCPILFHFFAFTIEKGETSERNVVTHIFQSYDKRTRPVHEDNQVILVKIGLNLISLLDVNEQQEYIKLAVTLDYIWHDDFLTWDPAEFNGTTSITVPADMVWRPDVTVVSTV